MKHSEFLRLMHRRIASGAVTPSAARRMGPKGTITAARKFLSQKVDLRGVGRSGKNYPLLLDQLTLRFVLALPKGARHWGTARKLLNIFLRDATYNVYLREAFGLSRIERFLEVPLDSHVAKEIFEQIKSLGLRLPDHKLPRWKTVISVDADVNRAYQSAVRYVAEAERYDAVHFDVVAWRKGSNYL